MEEKIDTIGRGSNWLMVQVTEAQKFFQAMSQNPMIRQMMPKGSDPWLRTRRPTTLSDDAQDDDAGTQIDPAAIIKSDCG